MISATSSAPLNLWYLLPPKEVENIQHSEHYIKHGEKKAIRRKIFETVQYDAFETSHLADFKKHLANKSVAIPESFRESSYLKMLQSGKYNIEKSTIALKQHVDWINNPNNHCLDPASTAFLSEGHVYLCGRDKQFRPVIIMNCQNLNLKKQGQEAITRAICVFLETVKKHMFVGGKVENWRFVIDTREKGVFDLPLKALGMIIDVMQVNFGGCLEKLYILNPSFGLSTMWSVIEKMIDEEAAAKIKFLKKKSLSQILEDIDPQYVEKKYSGALENLTVFWPPIDVYTTAEQRKEHERKLKEIAEQSTRAVQPSIAEPAAAMKVNNSPDRKEINIIGRDQTSVQTERKSERDAQPTDMQNEVKLKQEEKPVQETVFRRDINIDQEKKAVASTSAVEQFECDEKVAMREAGLLEAHYEADEQHQCLRSLQGKQIEITINKVDDVAIGFSNENQYNRAEDGVQAASPVEVEKISLIEAQPGIEIQEEEEYGGQQIRNFHQPTKLTKEAGRSINSQESLLNEDMKEIQTSHDPNNLPQSGSCCGTSQTCVIF